MTDWPDGASTGPSVAERPAQPYVAIKVQVTMAQLGTDLPPLNGEVVAWVAARGGQLAGPPFWKYNVVDMEGLLEVEVGSPVGENMEADERVVSGVLPAGRYATLRHIGHPDELAQATSRLFQWAAEQGLDWDVTPSDQGGRWAARLEMYLDDPVVEPDMSKWATVLAFKLRR